MLRKSGLRAAAVALLFAGSAHADSLAPVQGGLVAFGTVNSAIYYTVEPDGYRVVATLQSGEARSEVRPACIDLLICSFRCAEDASAVRCVLSAMPRR